jgi:hypothetical protein
MVALLVMSVIAGTAVSGLTGLGFLFWIAGGAVFICGLPFAVISSFVHGEVSYAQDREDYRQAVSEIEAEELADEREFAEDARLDRLIRSLETRTNIYNDNRQVHLHGMSRHTDGNQKGTY